MVAKAPIFNASLNLMLSQDSLDRVYIDHKIDTFKVDNAMVYQILSEISLTWMLLSM